MGRSFVALVPGIHTACYGNHDFDFGVDNLEAPGGFGAMGGKVPWGELLR